MANDNMNQARAGTQAADRSLVSTNHDDGKKLRPGGIVADHYNFDHWTEVFPDDDVRPVMCDSVFSEGFETLIFLAKSFAECAEHNERMRIVLDYDPQAKKTLVTYFRAKEKPSSSQEA